MAPGGADNVWITEVGDVGRWGSFDGFVDAVSAAAVGVTDRGDTAEGLPLGFDVTYASPANGTMGLGWTGPLTVDGTEVALHGEARVDNPFSTVPQGSSQVRISEAGATVDLDLASGTRTTDAVSSNEAFVRAAYADIIGRDATDEEVVRDAGALDAGGSPGVLLRTLTTSDEWLGRVVDSSYVTALGRAPDAAGPAYWIDQLRSGRTTVVQVGGIDLRLGRALRPDGWDPAVVGDGGVPGPPGRTPSPADIIYWAGQAQARSRGWVALTIADAPESRARRVRSLHPPPGPCRRAGGTGLLVGAHRPGRRHRPRPIPRRLARVPGPRPHPLPARCRHGSPPGGGGPSGRGAR